MVETMALHIHYSFAIVEYPKQFRHVTILCSLTIRIVMIYDTYVTTYVASTNENLLLLCS